MIEWIAASAASLTGDGPGILCTWTTEATMRRFQLTLLPLAALAFFLVADSAAAQESTTRGFTVGLHLTGASLNVEGDNNERESAGGGGIHVGYGLNRNFTLFLRGDGAKFDNLTTDDVEGEWTMGHFDVGARYNFASSLRKWIPFVEAALSYRAVSVDNPVVDNIPRNELSITGAGLTLGGGVDYYFSESWAIDLQLLWTGGEFTTLRVDNVSTSGLDFDATSSRVTLGVAWWP
jgi:opacity protein-like surface antigen